MRWASAATTAASSSAAWISSASSLLPQEGPRSCRDELHEAAAFRLRDRPRARGRRVGRRRASARDRRPAAPRLVDAAEFVPGQVIVQFRGNAPVASRARALSARSAFVVRSLGRPGLTLVRLRDGASVRAAVASSSVTRASPSPSRTTSTACWARRTTPTSTCSRGSTRRTTPTSTRPRPGTPRPAAASVVVAVIDSGVAYDHPSWTTTSGRTPARSRATASTTTSTAGSTTPAAGTSSRTTTRRSTTTATARTSPGRSAPRATTPPTSRASTGTSRSCRCGRRNAAGSLRGADDRQLDQLRLRRTAPTSSTAASAARPGRPRSRTRSSRVACKDTLFVFAAGNDRRVLNDNTDATNAFPCEYWRARPTAPARRTSSVSPRATRATGWRASRTAASRPCISPRPGVNVYSSQPQWSPRLLGRLRERLRPVDAGGGHEPVAADERARQLGHVQHDRLPGGAVPELEGLHRAEHRRGRTCRAGWAVSLDYNLELLIRDFNPNTGNVFDWFAVERSTSSAGPWEELNFYFGSSAGDFVALTERPHGARRPGNVYLRFLVHTDATVRDGGAHVDDVVVKCLTPNGETTPSSTAPRWRRPTSRAWPRCSSRRSRR